MTPRPARHVVRWFLKTFGYGGITLPPIGIFILEERMHEERLVRHENCHWAQAKQMGVLRWWATYLWYNLKHGYWNNPLEIEARAAELTQG